MRRRFVLTKTLEWNLYWAILDPMWDDDGVLVRREWLDDEAALRRRLRLLAVLNLAVAPFLLLFLLIYFTMKVGLCAFLFVYVCMCVCVCACVCVCVCVCGRACAYVGVL